MRPSSAGSPGADAVREAHDHLVFGDGRTRERLFRSTTGRFHGAVTRARKKTGAVIWWAR